MCSVELSFRGTIIQVLKNQADLPKAKHALISTLWSQTILYVQPNARKDLSQARLEKLFATNHNCGLWLGMLTRGCYLVQSHLVTHPASAIIAYS